MTVSELYQQVAQLGFEDSLESDERFYFAANRAILQVNSIRPAISSYMINHRPLKNLIAAETFSPVECSSELCFTATGAKSYYFEADGKGSVYIERLNGDEWEIIGEVSLSSSGIFRAYKGFIKKDGEFVSGPVRLRFVGEYLYYVKCVAMYAYIYSESENDIPTYGALVPYDLSSLTDDFLSLECPPIKAESDLTILNRGYFLDGQSTLLFPYDSKGCFKVLYRRRPRSLENIGAAEDDTTEIDLDTELCALLPLLVASYLWLEDEPDMASYYLTLYRERAADIERRIDDLSPTVIKSVNGW